MTFGPSFHRSFRRFLCIATANQRQRQSVCIATARAGQTMRRYGEAMAATEHMHRDSRWREPADYASLRRTNGSDRAYTATARAGQTMHHYGKAMSTTIHASRAGQTMHRYGSATAATEHASRRREQGRLCIATGKTMHRYGEATTAFHISCIATARAALISHG